MYPLILEICKRTDIDGYQDKGGLLNDNVYTDKKGNTISRDQFWANFDKENGTKIIR